MLEASRGKRGGGRPKRPDRMADTSCAVVGAAGCIGANPGINIVGAVLTAAEMASRLAKGQEIGSMFITDPQPTEYQRYVEAKRRREAGRSASCSGHQGQGESRGGCRCGKGRSQYRTVRSRAALTGC